MTTPPLGRYQAGEPRVPRTIGAISDALRAGQRARFFAELLEARRGPELDGVLSVWWGRAMRETGPGSGGPPAAVEAVALPGRIVRALPARPTRPEGRRSPGGSRREDGVPAAGDRGEARITVSVDPWLGAYAEELVEAGRAPSVSAVVNEALAERFRREQRARRVRAAKTTTSRTDAVVRDRADEGSPAPAGTPLGRRQPIGSRNSRRLP
ncbi:hypothetical protein [Streptosporangium sp. NPDC023615]|uniref:hypothetical protein n=1 Tax=Streptosporangium sp. NPDC023615 TaxID=3154794 RepID=UPI00343EE861